ncbi:MAG: hypothetical protein KDN19_18770 [Verrucomicrobiae bacterium]|nr:hypothetical protein [Verrucomicrobiae bacterium]
MKPNAEEEHLTRWIDGEISEEEAARLLGESRPDWRDEAAATAALGDQLRAAIPAERELPYADFFNHQIRRRIEGDVFSDEAIAAREDVAEEAGEERVTFPLFQQLRWLSAFGFAACLGGIIFLATKNTPGDRSEIVSTYAPDPEMSVVTAYNPDAEATIIQLIGAPSVPAEDTRTATAKAVDRVLFQLDSHEIGRPVSVIAREGSRDDMPGAVLVGF